MSALTTPDSVAGKQSNGFAFKARFEPHFWKGMGFRFFYLRGWFQILDRK